MISEGTRQLDQLLDAAISSFDIPDELYELAVNRYGAVGGFLIDRCGGRGPSSNCEVYTQGSFRLGTVVRPLARGEYDIDMVSTRDIAKESTTQADLKAGVGDNLAAFVAEGPEGDPALEDGKRCWTLVYSQDPFHIDVLPAIPDRHGQEHAILLTDRELREWQHSNPIDYATWFRQRMAEEFADLRSQAAAAAGVGDVEDVPDWKVKTALQRTVQALKRHRDLYFEDAPDDTPASIIITTLAARSYARGESLRDVLVAVTARMPSLVEQREGVWWVPNPVLQEENFADRWRGRDQLASRFFEWVDQAHTDFAQLGEVPGVDRVLAGIGSSLGAAASEAAGATLGSGLLSARRAGELTTASGGLLTMSGRRPVKPHEFHGDAT